MMLRNPVRGYSLAFVLVLALTANSLLSPADGIAGIDKGAHINVAAMHFYSGETPPVHIEGEDEAALLLALRNKAQLIFMSRTTSIKDGDVLSISSDVLRDGVSLEDFGVDCEILVHTDGEKVKVGGKFDALSYDVVHNKEIDGRIVFAGVHVKRDWTLVGYDAKSGVALYVDEEIGVE